MEDKTKIIECHCDECRFNNSDKKECSLFGIKMSDAGYCLDYSLAQATSIKETQ